MEDLKEHINVVEIDADTDPFKYIQINILNITDAEGDVYTVVRGR